MILRSARLGPIPLGLLRVILSAANCARHPATVSDANSESVDKCQAYRASLLVRCASPGGYKERGSRTQTPRMTTLLRGGRWDSAAWPTTAPDMLAHTRQLLSRLMNRGRVPLDECERLCCTSDVAQIWNSVDVDRGWHRDDRDINLPRRSIVRIRFQHSRGHLTGPR